MGINVLDDGSLEKIFVVPHSHHDYSWVYERAWHIQRYILVFNDVLDWLAVNPDAKWLIDNVIHSLIPFVENCPERMDELKRYVKEGRIEIANGGYSLARPSYVGEETFVRNLIAGDVYFKKMFDIENIPFYNNLDTASGQQQLPQILTLAGFKYYRFQRPEISLDKRGVPRAFYWEGLDKTKILVARGFGGGFLYAQYTNLDFNTQWSEIKERFYNEELSHRRIDGLCDSNIEMVSYGCDDSRPPLSWFDKEICLDEFIREWNISEKVQLKYSTAGEYFNEMEKQDLPTFSGGLDDGELTFNLPAKGEKSMWRMRGDLDKLLVRLENICTMAAMLGDEYPYDEIEKLWYNLFEITGHAIDFVQREDNDELMNIAVNVKSTAQIMINQYLADITKMISYSEGMQELVVNTQCFDREETVKLYITSPTGIKGFDLYDANGEKLEYQVIRQNAHLHTPEQYRRFDFTGLDILAQVKTPAFGYNAVITVHNNDKTPEKVIEATMNNCREVDIKAKNGKIVLNNGVMDITFKNGAITKIQNHITDKTIKNENNTTIMRLRCVQTEPYKGWMFENKVTSELVFMPSSWELTENGPIRWRYRIHGSFIKDQNAVIDIIINKNTTALEYELILDTKPLDCYYMVDFKCDQDTVVYSDVYFGVEPRDAKNMVNTYGETYIEGQIYGRNFTAFETYSQPVAIVSKNCSVYYVHDFKNNYMSLFLVRNCIHSNSEEDWTRNLPEEFALDGKNKFEFALYLNDKIGEYGDIQRFVKAYHHPLMISMKNNKNVDGIKCVQSLIDMSSKNLIQSALFMQNDYIYIRFFETQGETAQLYLKFERAVKSATVVDFFDKRVDNIILLLNKDGNTISALIEPFKIVTLKIKLTYI